MRSWWDWTVALMTDAIAYTFLIAVLLSFAWGLAGK